MFACQTTSPSIASIRSRTRRRGIAVVLVLGLLAVTLAISYATLHGQGVTSQLARNNSRALDARAAARSGLAAALRKISESGWAGVTVPISANVTNTAWYSVSFTTGDIKLASTDALYSEYPFRLTIDSIGYAADPINPAIQAQHHSRCVVQLVRKKLLSEPANWSTLTGYTVYQYSSQNLYAQFPVKINGSACFLGKLMLCTEYPGVTTARDQYLGDLNARQLAGLPDYRPFPATVSIALSRQDLATTTILTSKLGMVLVDNLSNNSPPLDHPGSISTYQLYPGGKSYTTPIVQNVYGNPIQNVTLAPDPVNNPLGIFRMNGSLSIQNNVTITGTLVADSGGDDVQIYGTGVVLQPNSLPLLYGSSQVYQLPTTMIKNDLRMNSGSQVQLSGTTMVWDEFELKSGTTSSTFAMTGSLIANSVLLRGRTSWVQNTTTWSLDKTQFTTQSLNLTDPNRSIYFPDYLEKQKGFTVKPALTFSPDSSGVKPHWHDWSQPVYQADPADPGLRWELVRWEENL